MPEYLEDIKKDFDDNYEEVRKQCKPVTFDSVLWAREYRMHSMNKGLDKLGFNPMNIMNNVTTQELAEDMIDQALAKNQIHIEDWSSKECEDDKRGLYIFKNGELVYFISHIEQSDNLIGKKTFTVRTNIVVN